MVRVGQRFQLSFILLKAHSKDLAIACGSLAIQLARTASTNGWWRRTSDCSGQHGPLAERMYRSGAQEDALVHTSQSQFVYPHDAESRA